ncbi:Helix-turn-helix domain containing protein [uncultured Caudovirales phage]|uniref:Helix-turn-helix domain containing protein n=1 Tax=uncultured Caudovirales phage TaxID=2100421 RepID=A0A6J5LZG9_9CAUD|nr:Helix-turn-helix domain containing protein [uncultured Caudovirales phage]
MTRSFNTRANRPTRKSQVLTHLLSGRTLTQGEATVLGYGTRLAARVLDLKRDGHNIQTKMKFDIHGNPYGEYKLLTVKPHQRAA